MNTHSMNSVEGRFKKTALAFDDVMQSFAADLDDEVHATIRPRCARDRFPLECVERQSFPFVRDDGSEGCNAKQVDQLVVAALDRRLHRNSASISRSISCMRWR